MLFLFFWLFFLGVVGTLLSFFFGREGALSRFGGRGRFVSRLGAAAEVGDGLPETQRNKGG